MLTPVPSHRVASAYAHRTLRLAQEYDVELPDTDCTRPDCSLSPDHDGLCEVGPADHGSATVAVFLLSVLIFGLLLLAVIGGRHVMCDAYDDGLRYCPGYAAQR